MKANFLTTTTMKKKQQFEPHKFDYKWTLKDANFAKSKGTVFSCFACGGGVDNGL